MTQQQFVEASGIPQSTVNGIVNRKAKKAARREIGKLTAKRLRSFDPNFFTWERLLGDHDK